MSALPILLDIDRPPHKHINEVPAVYEHMTLLPEDLYTIQYELIFASLFSSQPLQLEVPELEAHVGVGLGYGGLSWSLFQRTPKCTVCGRCCGNLPHRRTHWWFRDDNRPSGLRSTSLVLNGQEVVAHYWLQPNKIPCHFLAPIHDEAGNHLVEENDLKMHGCLFHNVDETCEKQIKPVHCMSDPQTRAVKVRSKKGERYVLSRRHYSRNWRWPQCPVDLDVKPTRDDFVADGIIWKKQLARWSGVPGIEVERGFNLWQSLVKQTLEGNPPKDTVYFEDAFV